MVNTRNEGNEMSKQVDVLANGQTCSMGVGCDETGICYALAHGEPERCGKPAVQEESLRATISSEMCDLVHSIYRAECCSSERMREEIKNECFEFIRKFGEQIPSLLRNPLPDKRCTACGFVVDTTYPAWKPQA